MNTDITIKIGGEAGFGIMSAGSLVVRAVSRLGYHVIAGNEYPSLIRGGQNIISVRIAVDEIFSLNRNCHILVALQKETALLHKDELSDGSVLLYDPGDMAWDEASFGKKLTYIPIPLTEITKKLGGEQLMRNVIAVGAVASLVGIPFVSLTEVITAQFSKKGEAVVSENIAVAKAGFDAVSEDMKTKAGMMLAAAVKTDEAVVVNGSEAVGFGCIQGGCTFAAIYPMTPINALITFFSEHGKKAGIVYKQPEDEIAGIIMAIGASYAGARSMVATSGGGFALMVEGISLSGITEVPIVVDLGMRPGPATGMPTWTEQGELRMVLHAGHGDFPRIVLAPGDAAEAVTMSAKAFDLAYQFQVPVFILTDKYLNENTWQVKKTVMTDAPSFKKEALVTTTQTPPFKRYALNTDSGVSPRTIPGVEGGQYLANSYEHDEDGWTTEDAGMRKLQVEKRMKKANAIINTMPLPIAYGDPDASLTFVSFGSTKGPILEAIQILGKKGMKAKLIHFSSVFPFAPGVKEMLSKEKKLISIEGNVTAQLAGLIRQETGIDMSQNFTKYDGRQWMPEEIVEQVESIGFTS